MAEKRIYVVVAETVTGKVFSHFQYETNGIDTGNTAVYVDRAIKQPAGRLMAQCAHVVSMMRMEEASDNESFSPITTIVLSVPNSKALRRVLFDLNEIREKRFPSLFSYFFMDNNPEVYGTDADVMTAICTSPVVAADVEDAIGHLELYGA